MNTLFPIALFVIICVSNIGEQLTSRKQFDDWTFVKLDDNKKVIFRIATGVRVVNSPVQARSLLMLNFKKAKLCKSAGLIFITTTDQKGNMGALTRITFKGDGAIGIQPNLHNITYDGLITQSDTRMVGTYTVTSIKNVNTLQSEMMQGDDTNKQFVFTANVLEQKIAITYSLNGFSNAVKQVKSECVLLS